MSACARDLDISRPTARKWKPTEQAEPTKKRGKLSRILNILKERKRAPLFLDYCRRLSVNSVKTSRPGTHGRVFVGSACQRPAEIEQRTTNKPLQNFIQENTYPVKKFYRVSHRLEQPISQNLNPRRGDIIFTAPGIDFFKNQFWESRRAAVVENYISPEGGGKNSRGGG